MRWNGLAVRPRLKRGAALSRKAATAVKATPSLGLILSPKNNAGGSFRPRGLTSSRPRSVSAVGSLRIGRKLLKGGRARRGPRGFSGDRPGCPDGSPAHWTGVCSESRCACPCRVEADAPCCRQLALSLEVSRGSRLGPLTLYCAHASRHRPGSSLLPPGNARPGPGLARRGPGGSRHRARPRPPACLPQALCAPDLQLLHVKAAREGRSQALSSRFLSFRGAWTGLGDMPALRWELRPCRLQAEATGGHRHSEARRQLTEAAGVGTRRRDAAPGPPRQLGRRLLPGSREDRVEVPARLPGTGAD